MKNTKPVKEFISNIAEKNYSQANASLQRMIETKLKERVQRALAVKK
jgi:hypothetical protein